MNLLKNLGSSHCEFANPSSGPFSGAMILGTGTRCLRCFSSLRQQGTSREDTIFTARVGQVICWPSDREAMMGGGTEEPGNLWYVSSQKVLDGSGTSGADAIQVAVAGYSANR